MHWHMQTQVLLKVKEVPDLNLKCKDRTSNYSEPISFHFCCNWFFIDHTAIWHCVLWAILTVVK